MECPRCHDRLQAQAATARCPAGHGRFVPAGALGSAATRRVARATATLPSTPCPACKQMMHLRHIKRIDIDVCACGVWLDAGEEKALRERHPENVWAVAELVAWIAAGLGGIG